MKIFITLIGNRQFLNLGEYKCIPIDKIVKFNLNAPNGGCSNTVTIEIENEDEPFYFTYEKADSIREFLAENAVG